MKIKYVTLTGADNRTDISEMKRISEDFEYVEWAILFSQSKVGTSRYPTYEWIDKLANYLSSNFRLSAHLCGIWAKDACKGNLSFLYDEDIADMFSRIQINLSVDDLRKSLQSENNFFDCALDRPTILGGSYKKANCEMPIDLFTLNNVYPLFDCSGGRGILPDEWPKIPLNEQNKNMFCGYAGGLGPDNLKEELSKIESVVGDAEIWIDMETKLRDNEVFDLNKCIKVLEIAERWT